MTGSLEVLDPVSDKDFGVETNQPFLQRNFEYYCWEETAEKKDDKTVYTYKSVWTSSFINSDKFEDKAYRCNVRPSKDYGSKSFKSKKVTLGKYKILDVGQVAAHFDKIFYHSAGYKYSGNSDKPRLGDTRTSFSICAPFLCDVKTPLTIRG
jgi:hypothetical protein